MKKKIATLLGLILVALVFIFLFRLLSIEYVLNSSANKLTANELADVLRENELTLTEVVVNGEAQDLENLDAFHLSSINFEDQMRADAATMNFCYGEYIFSQKIANEFIYYHVESGAWPALVCPDESTETSQQTILENIGTKAFFLLRNEQVELHFENGTILSFILNNRRVSNEWEQLTSISDADFSLMNTKWELVEIQGNKMVDIVIPEDAGPSVRFSEELVSVSFGCNIRHTFNTDSVLHGEYVYFSKNKAGTRMYCSPDEVMKLEAFLTQNAVGDAVFLQDTSNQLTVVFKDSPLRLLFTKSNI